MSSILKALEKAEESNGTKRLDGSSDLIRTRSARPVWVMPVSVICGAGVATLITFAAMGGFSRKHAAAPASAVVAPAAPAAGAAVQSAASAAVPAPQKTVPVLPAAAPQTVTLPSSAPKTEVVTTLKVIPETKGKAAPVAASRAALPKTAAVASRPQQSALQKAPVEAKKAAAQPAAVQAAPAAPAPAPVPAPAAAPVVVAAPAHQEPKVSGIAWQGNGESSFAVVNGRAVLQGGLVDGYKVLEIHQDRVRFSGSNGNFDVQFGGDDK